MAEGDAKRWFKYGCFGCLGCLGLVLLVIALSVGAAWIRSRSVEVEDRVLTHPTPPAASEPVPEPTEGKVAMPRPSSKAPGRVVLDLSGAEFHIEPGDPGSPIRVAATYDRTAYTLKESSEEEEDGTWTYRVEFRGTGSSSWLVEALSRMFSSSNPEVRIHLPRDVPMALETKIEHGGLVAELGGLHLTSGILHVAMGGLQVKVSEPLAEPMERLELKTAMGGGEFRLLGNASPRVLDVSYSMGGLKLDLNGAWRADAEISLQGGMGGAEVRLPRDVRIEGVQGRGLQAPQKAEIDVRTLRFTTTVGMGNVDFK